MHRSKQQKLGKGIKSWEAELRPREKMMELGAGSMSNSELLAMLNVAPVRKMRVSGGAVLRPAAG